MKELCNIAYEQFDSYDYLGNDRVDCLDLLVWGGTHKEFDPIEEQI